MYSTSNFVIKCVYILYLYFLWADYASNTFKHLSASTVVQLLYHLTECIWYGPNLPIKKQKPTHLIDKISHSLNRVSMIIMWHSDTTKFRYLVYKMFLSHTKEGPNLPQSISSSSLSSKYWSHWRGTTSLNPSRNAFICSSTPRLKRHCTISLQSKDEAPVNYRGAWNNTYFFSSLLSLQREAKSNSNMFGSAWLIIERKLYWIL